MKKGHHLTEQQRANIGAGIKEANRRKRLSKAMKASWVRRRNRKEQARKSAFTLKFAAPKTPEEYDKMASKNSCLDDAAENAVYASFLATERRLYTTALKLLGHDKLKKVLQTAVANELKDILK